jgi:WD40 repeat protein
VILKCHLSVKTLEGHTNIVLCIQLVTDTILCSGSWDNTIKVWNLDTNTCIKTLHGHQDRVYCIRVLSRSVIISASHDKTIKVWNINTGKHYDN